SGVRSPTTCRGPWRVTSATWAAAPARWAGTCGRGLPIAYCKSIQYAIPRQAWALVFAGPGGEVVEPRQRLHVRPLQCAARSVALLADNDLGDAGLLRLLVVVVVAVDEHDHVGVLLDRAGLAQIAHQRPLVVARLDAAVELRKRHHRALQLLGQCLQAARD